MTDTITPASLRAHAEHMERVHLDGISAEEMRQEAARLEAESARDEYVETLAKVAWKARGIVTPWEKASGAYRDETLRSIRAVLDRLAADGRLLPEGGTGVTYDEGTLHRVYAALGNAGLSHRVAEDAVNEMQNLGILFREREVTTPAVSAHNPWDASCIRNIVGEPTRDGERCETCSPAVSVPDSGPDGTPEKPWPTWQDVPEGVKYWPSDPAKRWVRRVNRGGVRFVAEDDGSERAAHGTESYLASIAPFVRVDGDQA